MKTMTAVIATVLSMLVQPLAQAVAAETIEFSEMFIPGDRNRPDAFITPAVVPAFFYEKSAEQFTDFFLHKRDFQTAQDFFKVAAAIGKAGKIPGGSVVFVERMKPPYGCIRPRGEEACWWADMRFILSHARNAPPEWTTFSR